MKYLIFNLITFLIIGKLEAALKLPDTWTKCKVPASNDNKPNKCLIKAVSDALKLIGNVGEPSLNIPSLEPLKIKKMSVGSNNPGSPVNLLISLKNSELYEISTLTVKSVSGKLSSPKDFSLHLKMIYPRLIMTGNYETRGRVLFIPADGEGNFNITIGNVECDGYLYGQPKIKDGKEYIKLNNQSAILNFDEFNIYLDNFFNANGLIVESVNRLLNQNWKLLADEIKPTMEEQMSLLFLKLSKKVFDQIPYNEIFITD